MTTEQLDTLVSALVIIGAVITFALGFSAGQRLAK
jgi:hypothetical protein